MQTRRQIFSPCALLIASVFARLAPAQRGSQPAPLLPATTRYIFNVTVVQKATDCFEKSVLVVNGEHNKQIEVVQGSTLEVVVYNNLPADWPLVSEGISIHWHGFNMHGAQWYDGVGYLAQCPIKSGFNFTYRFRVDEEPGTYFWHGHSGMEKVDSFYGPLIVRPPPGAPEPAKYNEERILLLADNYHAESAPLTFALNRPFDAGKVTNTSGAWDWVAVPQSILLNKHGYYGDCTLLAGSNTAIPPKCNVTLQWVPPGRSSVMPFNTPKNPGCSRYNMTVEAGKTYRIRMINAGSLLFYTVCFDKHNVTIIAADAYPVNDLSVPCVDINLGQRYDVLLQANQPPGNYWINALAQNATRTGSPGGYGVLRYTGVNATLPTDSILQPESAPAWSPSTVSAITLPNALVTPGAVPPGTVLPKNEQSLRPPNRTHIIYVNMTQPLLPSGQLRWALNNVATYGTPDCEPTLARLHSDPSFMSKMAQYTKTGNSTNVDMLQSGPSGKVAVYLEDGTPAPSYPVAGQRFMPLKTGDVVDVVYQNLAANANGGDYRGGGVGSSRTAQEQHPLHLHGHHFWLLGQGMGIYNESTNSSSLNYVNPAYRDSCTVFKNGWTVMRFKADNPGIWILHCHTDWHLFMGQKMYFATSPEEVAPPPGDLPQCPSTCMYNFGAFTPEWVRTKWGDSGYSV